MLYLQKTPCPVAVPQYISGRTSYLHVRLAFHPYPQVIPQFCNTGEFEPRRPFTAASLCPWIAHVVSGRIIATSRPIQTRFPCGCPSLATVNLSGPLARLGGARRRCTRRIILQKARHQPLVAQRHSGLWLLVSTWFQGLFHPPCGALFTFPSRYLFTIGR